MAWHNESRRHRLASKGIKTALDVKPLAKIPRSQIIKLKYDRLRDNKRIISNFRNEMITRIFEKENVSETKDSYKVVEYVDKEVIYSLRKKYGNDYYPEELVDTHIPKITIEELEKAKQYLLKNSKKYKEY